ncbi:MAG TPA: DsbA family protein [Armatimonadota bacterium]|nr:DsbA family protein [Armatimonadota bacterium]
MDTANRIEIAYFTDPLCSWSWALEPHWHRLREEWGERLAWRYHMGGMLPDWFSYRDPLNSVGQPAHMGPQWFYVRSVTGVPLDERIWLEDPPTSSYPACIAVKAAERQGQLAGDACLRRLREAVMLERRNIARREVLLELAEELRGALDPERFLLDLDAEETLEAFRSDLRETRYREIGRFPTLIVRRPGGRAALLVGYRPYEALAEALEHLAHSG